MTKHEQYTHEFHVVSFVSGILTLFVLACMHDIIAADEVIWIGIIAYVGIGYCVWSLYVIRDYVIEKARRRNRLADVKPIDKDYTRSIVA